MTTLSKTKKQNKTKQNKTKLNKTKLNKTKLNKTKLKTKNTGGLGDFLTRNEYKNIDELQKTISPNTAEKFKIECIDYDYEYEQGITVDNGHQVQIAEITFSKKDIIPIGNNEEGFKINQPVIYKTGNTPAGIPRESLNIFMPRNPADVELRFNKNKISLYDKVKNIIIKEPVSLIRTTGQLFKTTGNKLISSFMPKSNVTNPIPESNVTTNT